MQNKLKHNLRDFNRWSLSTMIIGLFISIPLITLVIYVYVGPGDMWNHIIDHFLLEYIQNSITLILGTGIICFFFGVSTAWVITKYDFPFRKYIKWALFLPLAIPSYIVAYAYVGLFGNSGTFIRLLQTLGFDIQKIEFMNIYGLIWVLSCSLFPYVYASTMAMFSGIPKNIQESSQLLGASDSKYFLRIALPFAFPAISGGLFLVFMEVLNDYGAAKYYGVQTFTTGIFRTWTMLEDLQSAVYLSAMLVILVFILNSLIKWYQNRKSYAVKGKIINDGKIYLSSVPKPYLLCIYGILAIPLLFGFIFPTGQLIYWGIQTYGHIDSSNLLYLAFESLKIALIATFCIVLISIALIYFTRWNHLKSIYIFRKLSTIGYIIPGAIIGISIIRSSQTIINFFENKFHLEIGFLFYGSSAILIYAYVFRFLAVAYHPLEANSLKIGKQLQEASFLLGIGKMKTLLKIDLPLMRTAFTSVTLLVMIDILKELPLTLILKPYHIHTLAVKAYEYADDELVAEAAIPALILILIIIILMSLASYLQDKISKNE